MATQRMALQDGESFVSHKFCYKGEQKATM